MLKMHLNADWSKHEETSLLSFRWRGFQTAASLTSFTLCLCQSIEEGSDTGLWLSSQFMQPAYYDPQTGFIVRWPPAVVAKAKEEVRWEYVTMKKNPCPGGWTDTVTPRFQYQGEHTLQISTRYNKSHNLYVFKYSSELHFFPQFSCTFLWDTHFYIGVFSAALKDGACCFTLI